MEVQFQEKFAVDGNGTPVKLGRLNLFCDASGISVPDDAYSIGGFTLTQFGTPIAWKSQKQTVRADSTCASEYIALSDGIQWAEVWGHLSFFLWEERSRDISLVGLPSGTLVWTDSTSAKDVAGSEMQKPSSRYLGIRWFRVKDNSSLIRYVKTADQKADCFTKPPTLVAIRAILTEFGMCPIQSIRRFSYVTGGKSLVGDPKFDS